MTLISQLPARRSLGAMSMGSLEVGLMGSIASARGVRVVAYDGGLNRKVENQFLTKFRTFSHLLRLPLDCTMNVARKGARPYAPTHYFSPDVPFTSRGESSFMGAICFFGPDFFAGLSETEDGFRFKEIDYLADIQSERMALLGRSMFREAIAPGFGASLFAESIGLAIQVEIARYDGATQPGDSVRHGGLALWQMRRIESYVCDNLSADITLNELARLVGISVRHLSRVMRLEKGVSVHRWIANRRLSEARRLLTETDLPVQDIARRSAFHSTSAFASAFRAASGLTPGRFRLMYTQ
jgi:AraC-like DNA-binding protein